MAGFYRILGSHFDPILNQFMGPVLSPLFDVFCVVVLDPLQAQRPPKEGPSEDQTHLQGTFLLLFTRVLACRSFLLFPSVLIPPCSLLVLAWPLSLPFGSHFGSQNGSQNGFRNGSLLRPPEVHPHPPQLTNFLCCFLGVGGSFGRSTAAETPLFDISSLLLFVPHFVFGHPKIV